MARSLATLPDPLTDCPAQHGGAKRQQLSDFAACPKRNARGVTLNWLRVFTNVRRRDRLDDEFDRSLSELRRRDHTPDGGREADDS